MTTHVSVPCSYKCRKVKVNQHSSDTCRKSVRKCQSVSNTWQNTILKCRCFETIYTCLLHYGAPHFKNLQSYVVEWKSYIYIYALTSTLLTCWLLAKTNIVDVTSLTSLASRKCRDKHYRFSYKKKESNETPKKFN